MAEDCLPADFSLPAGLCAGVQAYVRMVSEQHIESRTIRAVVSAQQCTKKIVMASAGVLPSGQSLGCHRCLCRAAKPVPRRLHVQVSLLALLRGRSPHAQPIYRTALMLQTHRCRQKLVLKTQTTTADRQAANWRYPRFAPDTYATIQLQCTTVCMQQYALAADAPLVQVQQQPHLPLQQKLHSSIKKLQCFHSE